MSTALVLELVVTTAGDVNELPLTPTGKLLCRALVADWTDQILKENSP